MTIKVVIEYPETEEDMNELEETQARITLDILKRMLTPIQLDTLMEHLKNKRKA